MDKNNFEKDIDVPSKLRIMDDYNAKDCEQCSSDTVCCNCQNLAWYKLKEQLQTKEQECEELKETLNEGCLHNLTLMTEQRVLLTTLTEIKELLLKTPTDSPIHCVNAKSVILQKISECEGNNESK